MAKRRYVRGDLVVLWDSDICEHCENCVQSLPEVFRPNERPWIDLEKGDPDKIREVVRSCPPQAIALEEDQI